MTPFSIAMYKLWKENNHIELIKVLNDLYIHAIINAVTQQRKINQSSHLLTTQDEAIYAQEISAEFKWLLSKEFHALDLVSDPHSGRSSGVFS
jgi:hypothetical protein